MIAVTDKATQESDEKFVALEADARALAETHRDLQRAPRLVAHVFEPPLARRLERALRFFRARSSGDATLQTAAEWFLDNYYLIRRVARQVEEELPPGFFRRLPQLASGPAKGRPRIEALAEALVAKGNMMLDLAALRRFVDAYQEVQDVLSLTIAELWALPTILRATVLRRLVRFLHELNVPVYEHHPNTSQPRRSDTEAATIESISVEAGVGVERSIRALRALDTLDWKEFFQSTSRVEAILHADPAHIYARMDFPTCDSYRKVIESLAWATGSAEEDVANLAVALAREGASDERRGHVGYYLVAEGRPALEERLGYHPVGLERIRRFVTR